MRTVDRMGLPSERESRMTVAGLAGAAAEY